MPNRQLVPKPFILSRRGHHNIAHSRWTRLPPLFSKQIPLLMIVFVGYIMICIYIYLRPVPITDQAVHAIVRSLLRVELICARFLIQVSIQQPLNHLSS